MNNINTNLQRFDKTKCVAMAVVVRMTKGGCAPTLASQTWSSQ